MGVNYIRTIIKNIIIILLGVLCLNIYFGNNNIWSIIGLIGYGLCFIIWMKK